MTLYSEMGVGGEAMIEGDGERRPAVKVRQTLGVALGNALEFYDFLVFSFFALQIGQTYFPGDSPQSSLLAALATFGSGFLMRPLGAFIIGGLGDRLGRRPMMMLSFALIGLATFGVPLTPSYKDIGLGAPVVVIICRLVQGFALGGEMGVSTAFLAEAGPRSKRGSYIALQYAGQYAAILVAGLVGVGLARTMDDIALARWGFRIAMGLGVLIVPVGLILRGRLPETLHPKTAGGAPPRIATYARKATVGFVLLLSTTISTYVLNFMTTFAKTMLKLSSDISFGAPVIVGGCGLAWRSCGGSPLGQTRAQTAHDLANPGGMRHHPSRFLADHPCTRCVEYLPGHLRSALDFRGGYDGSLYQRHRESAAPNKIGRVSCHLRCRDLGFWRNDTTRHRLADGGDRRPPDARLVHVRRFHPRLGSYVPYTRSSTVKGGFSGERQG